MLFLRNCPHIHIWMKKTPIVAHLRGVGCKCCYTIPKANVKKLDGRGESAIFVGYAEHSKPYKLIDRSSGNVVLSRDVRFDEGSVANCNSESQSENMYSSEESDKSEDEQRINIDVRSELTEGI